RHDERCEKRARQQLVDQVREVVRRLIQVGEVGGPQHGCHDDDPDESADAADQRPHRTDQRIDSKPPKSGATGGGLRDQRCSLPSHRRWTPSDVRTAGGSGPPPGARFRQRAMTRPIAENTLLKAETESPLMRRIPSRTTTSRHLAPDRDNAIPSSTQSKIKPSRPWSKIARSRYEWRITE